MDLHCTGCGDSELSELYRLGEQTAILNYRFPDEASALAGPRGELSLAQCARCGLIFNATFAPDLVPYDSQYENRQGFSAAFSTYLEDLADQLITRHDLKNSHILEVGCGKGDFLRMLCARASATGEGYDTSFEGEPVDPDGRTRFSTRYLTAADVRAPARVVLCRHVVEHVPHVGAFLAEIHQIARRAGDAVTILETPRFEWIAENDAFWDLFYEHCNYFSMPALAWLCEQAGFHVLRHESVFGEQYQLIELATRPRLPASCRLDSFARRADSAVARLESQIRERSQGRGWAFWGAGAKGVSLVNRLSITPRFVIDINPAKQGCVIPGSRVHVVAPEDPRILELGLIAITNPNYQDEIHRRLQELGYAHAILAV